GGKGANQAMGLHRLGSNVSFLSRVGRDPYGDEVLRDLEGAGLDLRFVERDDALPTGLALVTLDGDGKRSIVVAPGANQNLVESNVDTFLEVSPPGGILVTQFEIPVGTVSHLLHVAKRHDRRTVVHASPAVSDFPSEDLRLVDLLVLNQTELGDLVGRPAQHMKTASAAAQELIDAGCGAILVTMGTRGVLVVRPDDTHFVSGIKVSVLDTHVGSSAFIAGLVHALSSASAAAAWDQRDTLDEAVHFGLAAMAFSLSRPGGQRSLGSADEVKAFVTDVGEARPQSNLPKEKLRTLASHTKSIRQRIIRMLGAAHSGHPGGSLSLVEILTSLYYHAMAYHPDEPLWPSRDRLILSKGHAAPALYATLMELGVVDPALETELRKLQSPLQGHPDMRKCPGIEMSTGSLGQGLSVANGMALAARHTRKDYRVYCVLGDGELQEGQNWEAAMTSAHYKLDNLCAILDYNALQIDGCIGQVKSSIEPLAEKWEAFGWHVITVDGNDLIEVCAGLDRAREIRGKPTILIAQTIKGRGVSFMEGVVGYHGSTLSADEVSRALAELEATP
ncbi:MAG: bifunctional hydroxymethylpyrimidine kinase/phosphomethylpyrimidine kinase, partial [Deltaproteobacteria bacterium]|nr:bifunctional hydroxymethylpyrimidine kinase/phosphomethylpyrimidine kinase [Deltaproteobacteria bacterium]